MMKSATAMLMAGTAFCWAEGASARESGGAAQPQASGSAASSESAVEEIVVTANKRTESIQDVPVSVVALPPAALDQAGIASTSELPQLVPGLTFNPSGEAKLNSFNIRGVGTYALTATLESSVGVAVDGIPLARVGGSITDMVDVERVEVLKGPQGMLFGKNATAGLISIVNRKPELGARSGAFNLEYGSYNEINVDGVVNLPIGDKAAVRVTGWRYGHDGFINGPDGAKYGEKNSYGVRAGLALEPTPGLSVTLIGQYDGRDERSVANTQRLFTGTTPFGIIVENWARSRGITPGPRNLQGEFYAKPYARSNNYYVTGLIDWDIGGGYVVSSATSYRSVETRGQMDPFTTSSPLLHLERLDNVEKYDQFTQELRIASPADQALSFVAGLFYYHFNVTDVQNQNFFGLVQPGISNFYRINTVTDELRNIAAFGEVTYRVLPGLRLIGGVRVSNDRTSASFNRTRVGTDVGIIPGNVPLFSYTPQEASYDALSYRFGAQFDLAPDVMIYATASRGYKGPGFNLTQSITPAAIVNDARVDPEIAKSYEVGVKSQFFDRRLTINLTAFDSTFDNFQTTVGLPTNPPTFVIQNAGQLKSTGVELELNARPTRGLSLGINGAYIDARYTDFDNAACYYIQPTLPAGSAQRPGFCVGGVQTLDGWQLAVSPKWSFNASARYETPVADDFSMFLNATYSWRSSVVYEARRDPLERQDGYGFANLTVGVKTADDRLTLGLYVRNLFDEHFVSRIRHEFGVYYQAPAYEARRRIGVQLSGKF
jgi:iron complex outermembrane receptor protein